jgi:hypothetical protein
MMAISSAYGSLSILNLALLRRNELLRRISFFFLVFSVWTGSSSSSISRFEVTPQWLCEGQKAVVSWETRGQPGMAVQDEVVEEGAQNCVASGRDTFAFTLVAQSKSAEVERRVEVVQLGASSTEPIVMRANGIEGREVVATGEKNTALWESRVEVTTFS